MAYLLLKGSDQSKYGSLCSGLSSQFALGNNQYPKDIQAATDILSSHKFDASYRDKASKGKDSSTRDKSSSKDGAKTSESTTCRIRAYVHTYSAHTQDSNRTHAGYSAHAHDTILRGRAYSLGPS